MSRPAYFGGANRPPARYNPAAKPAKTKPKKTTPKPAAPGSTVGLTPQQWVAQALRAEMAPLEYTEAARKKRAAETLQQTQYATQAIIKELGAQAAPVAAMFDNSLAQQKGYATDYANMLRDANPNAQIQADLQAVGAPAEQQAQIAGQNQANYTGQAAALFNTGGVIPGDTLLANRNAQVGFLAGLPTIAALQGQQALSRQRASDAAAYQDYVANKLKIAATGPQLLRQRQLDIYNAQQDAIRQENAIVSQMQRDQQLAQNAQALGDREAYQAAQIKLSQDRADLANARYQTQQVQFGQSLGLETRRADIAQQNADTAAKRAAAAAQAKADKAAAANLKTEKQRQSFFYSQRAKVFSAVKGLYNQGRSGSGGSGRFQTDTRPKVSRGKAFNVLWKQYYPVLNAAHFNRYTIRQMINAALDTKYAPAPTHDKQRPKTGAGRPG